MIAQDANRLRAAADYHRRAADEVGDLSLAIKHEEWMETLEEVADLLDRLARLVEPEGIRWVERWWWQEPNPLGKGSE